MKKKVCSKCKQEKEPTEFYKDKSRKGGYCFICKNCDLLKSRKWKKTDRGKESQIKSAKKYTKNNPKKRKAHRAVCNAIETGRLIKPKNCSICNKTDSRISGHHDDYNRPLDVIWVCDDCHPYLDEQRRLKELNNKKYKHTLCIKKWKKLCN